MFSLVAKAVRNPRRALRRICSMAGNILGRKKGVLIYIGLHKGRTFQQIFRQYRACYGFEANPEVFRELEEEYREYPHVHLFNVAVADFDGEVTFNISSNDGASSSIGNFDDNWEGYRSRLVTMTKTIKVPSINLLSFCRRHRIDYIDDYVSDIQGMDLQVLKTMRPFIERRRIGTITCETTKDGKPNIYMDLPDNTESGFRELLTDNYKLVARGWGRLEEGVFSDVPEEWWEMDCKWRAKTCALPPSRPRTTSR